MWEKSQVYQNDVQLLRDLQTQQFWLFISGISQNRKTIRMAATISFEYFDDRKRNWFEQIICLIIELEVYIDENIIQQLFGLQIKYQY